MLLFDSNSIDETNWKTERLEFEAQKIVSTLKSGNSFKIGNAIGAGIGTLGLIAAGGGVVSPFIGLLLATSALSSLVAYGCYCIDESEQLGVNPLWIPLLGGEEETVLSEILTDSERSHWEVIRLFGLNKVKKIEEAGLLDTLIEAVADIDLEDVDDRERMRIYNQSLKQIKDSVTLFPKPTAGIDRSHNSPRTRSLLETPDRDYWDDLPENHRTSDRLALPTATAKTFEWSTITRRPHLFVLGDTGSGKTSLVQWLIKTHYPQTSEVLVLDPHDRKGQWGDFPTIGRGRNFDAVELALENLVKEMDRRYASGSYDHQPKIVIIEEIPAIATNCKTAMSSIACLTLEARKVGIFLILLSQGWEVDSLGLKGKGSVRKSFLFISLGEFAIDKAKTLDPSVLARLRGYDRPCLVGDELAIVPDLSTGIPTPSVVDRLNNLLVQPSAPEPTPTPETPPSKIDLLSDTELEDLLEKVLTYAKRKERVKPSDVSSGLRSCRGYTAPEIMQLFDYLVEASEGIVRSNEFIPN